MGSRDNHSNYPTGVLWGLNETRRTKHLEWFLAQSKLQSIQPRVWNRINNDSKETTECVCCGYRCRMWGPTNKHNLTLMGVTEQNYSSSHFDLPRYRSKRLVMVLMINRRHWYRRPASPSHPSSYCIDPSVHPEEQQGQDQPPQVQSHIEPLSSNGELDLVLKDLQDSARPSGTFMIWTLLTYGPFLLWFSAYLLHTLNFLWFLCFYDSEPLCLLFSPSLLGYLFLMFKIPDYCFLESTPPNEARLGVPPLGSPRALYLATI